jgi:hypothetical protein
MKHILLTISSIFLICHSGLSQVKESEGLRILFQGLVIDASTFSPISNTQIMINREFSSISGENGTFSFYVNRNDTIVFKSLGYKQTMLYVSDTIVGREFIIGIYMNSDTLSIGEVIIIPRYSNLKSEILNAKSKTPSTMENARYNVAISAYQGRNSQNVLGDPASNYAALSHLQKVKAYERGGIPSDGIIGLNFLTLIPCGYLLIRSLQGLPEHAPALTPQLSDNEVDQIHQKYLESLRQRK